MIPNEPPNMEQIAASYRKLAILKALHRQNAFSANEHVMTSWLQELAMGGTREAVREVLAELAEIGVIKTEMRGFDRETMVFWLTERGLDYLEFRASVDGLPRIGPGHSPY